MTEQAKPIIVGVPKETFPGERRVALIADVVPSMIKSGAEVRVESGAGLAAGITDESYTKKGAKIATRDEIFAKCEVVFQVRTFGANPDAGRADLGKMRAGQIVIGTTDSLNDPSLSADLAKTGATVFSLELVPRITRAQSMDVLSSMATVAGYKAILLAAEILPRFFPMFMTAAGTIAPARVFIVGVGVAGLQAISTAKRLGAVVSAYDIRPAVKDQVKSVGAKFVEFDLQTRGGGGQGRLREGDGRGVLPQTAGDDGEGRQGARRGRHHRGGARQEGADPRHRGYGEGDDPRLGGRRPRGGKGRQLRVHEARRDGRRQRRDRAWAR